MTPTRPAIAAVGAIAARELRRLSRQPSELIAVVAVPGLIWLLLASGLAETLGDRGAAELIPGAVLLVVLFSAVFGSISLIEDRRHGLLRAALVTPTPPGAIALGKLLGAALVATVQAVPLLALALFRTDQPDLLHALGGALLALAAACLAALGVGGLSLAAAWRASSVRGYHALLNLVLMPAWLLSGAVFPENASARWLEILQTLNPLAWSRHALADAVGTTQGPALLWWIGAVAFAIAGVIAATAAPGAETHPRPAARRPQKARKP